MKNRSFVLKSLSTAPLFLAIIGSFLLMSGCATAPLPRGTATDYDVIVVGAGMGGLSAGTHLSLGGMKTLVVEQHYKVGGCTTSFERGEFTFEAALHEMSLGGGPNGGVVKTVLEKAGILDKIELIRLEKLGRSIFPNFEVEHPANEEQFRTLVAKRWPKEKDNFKRFHAEMLRMEQEVTELRDLFMANPVKALLTKITIPLRQRTLTHYRNHTVDDILDEFFEDEELKAALSQFWVYYGPPPEKQWGIMFILAQYSYIINGGWHIKGSSQALSNAYEERIIELGGEVLTDTLVTEIMVKDGRVHGIKTEDGKTFTSRYVVSNADPFQTYYKLVGKKHLSRKTLKTLKAYKPANSLAGVYLGLDVTPDFWGISDYEIMINASTDESAMYDAMMSGNYKNGVLSLTFHSMIDDYYAPKGKSTLVIQTYSNMDIWPDYGTPEYEKMKRKMMDDLINQTEKLMPNLRDHIEVEAGMTPHTIKNFTLQYKGVPYGLDLTVEQQDRMKHETEIAGLYFAGAWTWPSHSVGISQLSGFLASELVLKKDGLK